MKKQNLELRIFICFILTLLYVNYVAWNLNAESPEEVVREKSIKGFEIRIINDHANERLELTETLGQALAYIEEYSMHHDDLVAFDLSTGAKVASSATGNGVIYSGELSNNND